MVISQKLWQWQKTGSYWMLCLLTSGSVMAHKIIASSLPHFFNWCIACFQFSKILSHLSFLITDDLNITSYDVWNQSIPRYAIFYSTLLLHVVLISRKESNISYGFCHSWRIKNTSLINVSRTVWHKIKYIKPLNLAFLHSLPDVIFISCALDAIPRIPH